MTNVRSFTKTPVGDHVKLVSTAWTSFWFTPRDATVLGFIRLILGLLLVWNHISSFSYLEAFFGPQGVLPANLLSESSSYPYNLSWLTLIQSDGALMVAYVATLVVYLAFMVGLATRVSGPISLVCCLSYIYRNELVVFGYDQVMAALLFCTILGRNADCWTLKRAIARARSVPVPSVGTNIAIRLMQIEICIVYLCAGYAKALSGWFDGVSLWNALQAFQPSWLDIRWLTSQELLVRISAAAVVLWELQFFYLVWLRSTRRAVLLLALGTHIAIAIAMQLSAFSLVMLAGCATFIKREDLLLLTKFGTQMRQMFAARA